MQRGIANTEIAAPLGVSRPTVIMWRNRCAQGGLQALRALNLKELGNATLGERSPD
jgi:transposase